MIAMKSRRLTRFQSVNQRDSGSMKKKENADGTFIFGGGVLRHVGHPVELCALDGGEVAGAEGQVEVRNRDEALDLNLAPSRDNTKVGTRVTLI
jgi:hypothetical protein